MTDEWNNNFIIFLQTCTTKFIFRIKDKSDFFIQIFCKILWDTQQEFPYLETRDQALFPQVETFIHLKWKSLAYFANIGNLDGIDFRLFGDYSSK